MTHGESLIVAGIILGVFLSWRVTRSLERFRRARTDLRHTIDTIKGLMTRVREEGMLLVKYGTVALLIVGALIVAAFARGHTL